jgi:hypothetical protein
MDRVAYLKSLVGVQTILVRLRVSSDMELLDGGVRFVSSDRELTVIKIEPVDPDKVCVVLLDGDTLLQRTLPILEARQFLRFSRSMKETTDSVIKAFQASLKDQR